MILGTCNFGQVYNKSILSKREAFKILDYYYSNGGKYIDSALNYDNTHRIIAEWKTKNNVNDLKIISKIWNQDDFFKCLDELKTDKLYCMLARKSNDDNTIEFLKDQKANGVIQKYGISIYYPCELRQDVNVIFIPNNFPLWKNYLSDMILPCDIHVRSFFNKNNKDLTKAGNDYNMFKQFERQDLNHYVRAVIGVSNISQLKENILMF